MGLIFIFLVVELLCFLTVNRVVVRFSDAKVVIMQINVCKFFGKVMLFVLKFVRHILTD